MTLVFQAIWLVRYLWLMDNFHLPGPAWLLFCRSDRERHLRTQDITISNDTKKATKLGMIVFRDKQCFNTQFAHMSSVFCPDRQASLMPLSLNNSCPSTLHFKVPSKSTQLPLSKMSPFKKIWMPLSLFKMMWFPTLQQQAHGMISGGNFKNCSFNFYFK